MSDEVKNQKVGNWLGTKEASLAGWEVRGAQYLLYKTVEFNNTMQASSNPLELK